MYNPYSLESKKILITGASSGIGRATSIECSKLGATVIITGRNEERLKETFKALEHKEREHQMIVADLTVEEEREKLISCLPLINGFVNNAGVGKMLPLQFFSLPELEKVFFINSFIPMLLTKEIVRKKKMGKFSSMVFISSIAGSLNIAPANGIYGTSKCSMDSFMKYAALELAGKNIRCNSVNPGRINTKLLENRILSEQDREKDIELYPLKRYGEPMEVAHAVIYLLSDAAAWVTGINLIIDGGRTLK